MRKEKYDKLMSYLDIIESEMDKIAIHVGHKTQKEFFADDYEELGDL